LVCGAIQSRNWQDKEGNKRTTVEIIADEISFVERKSVSDGIVDSGMDSNASASSYSTSYDSTPKFEEISSDDDLPF
jgi:single-strand DNA-binding protein